MNKRIVAASTATVLSLGLLAGCGSSDDESNADSGPVSLTYWAWAPGMDKVAAIWNKENPDIKVTVKKQASGDDLVTKIITSAKAGKAPDLVQAEYQALPTLVSNDVLADISGEVSAETEADFSKGLWEQVTLGSDALYAVPQDSGPLMFYYRQDQFKKYDLDVPTTWDEFADVARKLKEKDSKKSLTTFSANDSGLFAGLAQQAGAKWWTTSGDQWKVGIDDAASKKVADFWGGLVKDGVIDDQPMYTPAWNKALNTGTQIAWVSAVWAPGVFTAAAPDTAGKWAMAPLPQWTAGESKTGSWGGSTTGVTNDSKHKAAAAKFASWLNTDTAATAAMVKEGGIYPAATSAQTGDALKSAPEFFSNQPDFYTTAATIAEGTAAAAWGPNVNVAYSTFKDAFGKAVEDKSDFSTALTSVRTTTVADLEKQGFKVSK